MKFLTVSERGFAVKESSTLLMDQNLIPSFETFWFTCGRPPEGQQSLCPSAACNECYSIFRYLNFVFSDELYCLGSVLKFINPRRIHVGWSLVRHPNDASTKSSAYGINVKSLELRRNANDPPTGSAALGISFKNLILWENQCEREQAGLVNRSFCRVHTAYPVSF